MTRLSRLLLLVSGAISMAVLFWALAMQGGSATANEVTPTSSQTGTSASGTVASGTRTPRTTPTAGTTATPPPPTATQPPPTATRPAPTATQPAGGEGCTPGFWKNHTDTSKYPNAWPPTGLTPGQRVDSVFTIPGEFSALADDSLLVALQYGGGSTDQEAAQILLRAAVAAVLNANHSSIDYPLSAASIISQVNAALATSDRATILTLQGTLDGDNNLGCSISGK